MKNNINKYYILTLAGILFLLGCKDEIDKSSFNKNSEIQFRIDSIGSEFIKQGKVVGFSIAIIENQDTLYNNSFGFVDSLKKNPTKNESIFLMASISKLIGSTIVMKLVEDGILDLEDKLIDLLPDFPNKDQANKINLRHLISMTSGLKEYAQTIDSIYLLTGSNPTRKDFYNFFSKHELDYEPGAFYKYSNSGFLLLPMIIEKATNSSFESQIERIINKPTGLDIKLISERLEDSEMSDYFELSDTTIKNRPHWPWIKGDGGMTISAIQLAHYPVNWMNGKIINENSFKLMISPTQLSQGFISEYGLGVKNGVFEGERMFGHSGGDKSTYSMMFHFPIPKITIVVLVNTNNTPANARNIFSEVARVILNKDKPDYKSKEIKSGNLSNFTGAFLSPGDKINQTSYIVLNKEDQHLYYAFDENSDNGEKMYDLGNDVFWIERWPYDRIHFVRNKHNEIVALKEFYGGYMSELKRKIE